MSRKDRQKFEENIIVDAEAVAEQRNLRKVMYQKDYWTIYKHPANQGQQ